MGLCNWGDCSVGIHTYTHPNWIWIQRSRSLVLPIPKRIAITPPITRLTRGRGTILCWVWNSYPYLIQSRGRWNHPRGVSYPWQSLILMSLFNPSLNPGTKVRLQRSTQAISTNEYLSSYRCKLQCVQAISQVIDHGFHSVRYIPAPHYTFIMEVQTRERFVVTTFRQCIQPESGKMGWWWEPGAYVPICSKALVISI